MGDDVILNKADGLEKNLLRINQVYDGKPDHLLTDQTRQESILLNLERACQAAIDIAMRIVRIKSLGIPKESREAFVLLEDAGIIDEDLRKRMIAMVGFRNIAVHNYGKLNLAIVQSVIENRLGDFRDFIAVALKIS